MSEFVALRLREYRRLTQDGVLAAGVLISLVFLGFFVVYPLVKILSISLSSEAVAVYQQSLALRDDDAGSWHNLGVTLQELGRDEEAAAAYRRASVLTAAKREGTPGPRGHVSCSNVQHPVLRRRRSGLQRCDEEVGQLGDSEPGLHSRRRGEPDQRG